MYRIDGHPERTLVFEGTPDAAAIRELARAIGRSAASAGPLRVEFRSRGCAPRDEVDTSTWIAFGAWLRRSRVGAGALAVVAEAIDLPSATLFLAFDRRTATAGGAIHLNSVFGGCLPIDLGSVREAREGRGSQRLRRQRHWAHVDFILERTRMSRAQLLHHNRAGTALTGMALMELGLCTELP